VRPLRILQVVANRWWTGSADPALDLARALKERGHAVWFACARGDVLEAYVRAAGVSLVEELSLERTVRLSSLAAQIGTPGAWSRARDRGGARPPDPRSLAGGAGRRGTGRGSCAPCIIGERPTPAGGALAPFITPTP
jgi:hypothetical protein